jgi:ADP-ribose pyrophosphatase YjhB (NUDIX family)
MNYCPNCGSKLNFRKPNNDDRERFICDSCGEIHYQNPNIIVCSLPCYKDQVLLCRRSIEPRYGLWTLPGGFMENDETTHEGALRETLEEACARIKIHGLYTYYNLPHINQVHLFYRATLLDLDFAPGEESLEVELFQQNEIPWDEIAFPAVSNTLEHYYNDLSDNDFPLHAADVIYTADNKRIIKTHS